MGRFAKNYLNLTNLLVIGMTVLTVGCEKGSFQSLSGGSTSDSIRSDLADSLDANAKATDHIAWETSPSHPSQIFAKWQTAHFSSNKVCQAFTQMTGEQLSVFEEEIRNPRNNSLVANCKANVLAQIKTYLMSEKPATSDGIPASEVNFQFQKQNVEIRDFSAGYFALTMNLPKKTFMLTFDDGPHAQYTDEILATLRAANLKAVFFEMGNNVHAHPEITKRVAAEGHEIGSHSVTHACLANNSLCDKSNASTKYHHRLSFAQATAEITGGAQAVYDVLGWIDPFFRFPDGESSADLKQFLAQRGVGEFYWSLDSNDWRKGTPGQLTTYVADQLKHYDHGIILMHDIQHRTAIALPSILKELYFGGYQLIIVKPSDPQARYHSQLVHSSGATIPVGPTP